MLENTDEILSEENSKHTETVKSQENLSDAVKEIEDAVAEQSEGKTVKHQVEMLDYSVMDLEQLNVAFDSLLQKEPIQAIKANVDAIRNEFNTKFNSILAEKKEQFLATATEEVEVDIKDFYFSSPDKTAFDTLFKTYKKQREAYYDNLENKRKNNLEQRKAIIEELKSIIENADPKTMYNEYKVLNDRWKTIGAVPTDHYNDVWKVYHHHVERFYDLLNLNKNFRELDFKHNLEEKLKIIDKATVLAEAEDVNVAFKQLQNLHLIWKEEIGPVAREHRENIWQKFSDATKKLHDRRHEYFKAQRAKVQVIIDAKLEVIKEIDSYDTSGNKKHKDWQNSIKDIEAFRQKYFEIGKLPYGKSETLWQQFKEATKKFNVAKNTFYKAEKHVQNENLKKKIEMVELVESLKDSEDWENTSNVMKRVQSDWKKIGHVPRKFSDDIWKRFKAACNHYFNRLGDRNEVENKENDVVISKKKAFLDEFKAKETVTLEEVQEAIVFWRKLGALPRNLRFLDGKFYKVVDAHLDKQDMDRSDIEMMRFKNSIENHLEQKDYRKLDNEQFFIRKKIDETVREMQQLENNLSFISNPTDDNPFVINVRKGVQKFKLDLDLWKKKLDYIRSLEY